MSNEVRASHILVPSADTAAKLKTSIEGGTDFGEAARQYSTCPSKAKGGDLGWFGRGQMVKAFEEAAFNAPENTVAGPVQTQFGYHLIKVTGKR